MGFPRRADGRQRPVRQVLEPSGGTEGFNGLGCSRTFGARRSRPGVVDANGGERGSLRLRSSGLERRRSSPSAVDARESRFGVRAGRRSRGRGDVRRRRGAGRTWRRRSRGVSVDRCDPAMFRRRVLTRRLFTAAQSGAPDKKPTSPRRRLGGFARHCARNPCREGDNGTAGFGLAGRRGIAAQVASATARSPQAVSIASLRSVSR